MKKLALVVPSLVKGGGVPAVARFVKDTALRSGRYELKLVSLCMSSNEGSSMLLRKPITWLRGAATTIGEWEGLPFTHVGAHFAELEIQRYRPRKALSDLLADCDLVQVVCGSPAWANAVVGLGKPVALQVATRVAVERRQRDRCARGIKGWWNKLMTAIVNRLDDRALRSVCAIQVENPWMLEYANQLNIGRSVDIRYAPPGVDAALFTPLAVRNPADAGYILCVGRLSDPRKNIGILLEAYALLPPALRGRTRLVLAGLSGPDERFWQRARVLGVNHRISFIERPSRTELVKLYQGAAIFALPSDEEGLGVVVLEAMACGVPVVSTRSGGPDGIISNGDDGYLVPLDNPAAMTEALARLLEDSAHNLTMGHNARATIEARYEEKATGEVFVDMWDQLLERAASRKPGKSS